MDIKNVCFKCDSIIMQAFICFMPHVLMRKDLPMLYYHHKTNHALKATFKNTNKQLPSGATEKQLPCFHKIASLNPNDAMVTHGWRSREQNWLRSLGERDDITVSPLVSVGSCMWKCADKADRWVEIGRSPNYWGKIKWEYNWCFLHRIPATIVADIAILFMDDSSSAIFMEWQFSNKHTQLVA